MSNEERDEALYRYPGSQVLRNTLDIRDAAPLAKAERRLFQDRSEQGAPGGNFDLAHLKAIHRHLFQDIYPWGGDIRQTNIHKGGHWFHPANRIETAMVDVHRRLAAAGFLRDRNAGAFCADVAEFIGDVNRVHPFREGNGRTQREWLQQLANQAGHAFDYTRMTRREWIEASIRSFQFDDAPMIACLSSAAVPLDERRRETKQERVARLKAIQKQDRSQDRFRDR